MEDLQEALQAQAGSLGSVDCWSDDGYALVTPDATDAITAPRRPSRASRWPGVRAFVRTAHALLLLTVPGHPALDASAIALSQVPVAGGIQVSPVPDPPTYASFTWAMGPAGSTDCAKIQYADSARSRSWSSPRTFPRRSA